MRKKNKMIVIEANKGVYHVPLHAVAVPSLDIAKKYARQEGYTGIEIVSIEEYKKNICR